MFKKWKNLTLDSSHQLIFRSLLHTCKVFDIFSLGINTASFLCSVTAATVVYVGLFPVQCQACFPQDPGIWMFGQAAIAALWICCK